jgi:hypothetical protein
MPCYRIRFINEFARNHRLLRVCQRTIVIRSAESPDEAIEAAKSRFAGLEGIRDWRIHASMIEIEPLDAVPPPEMVGSRTRPTAAAHRSAR